MAARRAFSAGHRTIEAPARIMPSPGDEVTVGGREWALSFGQVVCVGPVALEARTSCPLPRLDGYTWRMNARRLVFAAGPVLAAAGLGGLGSRHAPETYRP
jgi:hypothetical protein